jgi:hypothetical protein
VLLPEGGHRHRASRNSTVHGQQISILHLFKIYL